MTQITHERDNLAEIVTPIIDAVPQLLRVIKQRDTAVAVLLARTATLEAELTELQCARHERDEAIRQRNEIEADNQTLHEKIIRLECRNDERGLPRVCSRCASNTVTITCRCGETLLEDKPYQD